MPVVKSKLRHDVQEKIKRLLGNVTLCLLYKGSIHGFTSAEFHNKCDFQGPTVTVAYNQCGYIFGGFTSKDFSSVEKAQFVNDKEAFIFSINANTYRKEILQIPVENAAYAVRMWANSGPNFGNGALHLLTRDQTVQSVPNTIFSFDANSFHGNDTYLVECEVYRVEALPSLLDEPWRKLVWTAEKRREYMQSIQNYKPIQSSIPQVRILLIGPVGAGKSSFFNSVNSVFRGHVTSRAMAGSAASSLTTKFKTYSIRAGREGKPLPIVLCDTMGLEETKGAGLCLDDINYILKGHVPDNYQFIPDLPIQPETATYVRNPSFKDQIHCVVFVLEANKVSILPNKLLEKLRAIRAKVNEMAISQLVLLTKVDEACPFVAEDTKHVYKSKNIEAMIHSTGAIIGIPVSFILPVKNYSSEIELENGNDILILSALTQMQRLADDYFENCCTEDETNSSF
ncbi:interferon-induced protein 44-like [Protopterus annectens]|uniref:interferon-induced protein 44-like n=1 Tax=Protopterus annectens TaxID=7888 RepID=UPI001CF9B8A8|nr:interferon-induced protein 44-like [Protopterus annectens]